MATTGTFFTEIVVHGRHTDLTDRFREHAAEAAGKLDRFGVPLQRIDVEITHEHNPRNADRAFKVEFTCRGNGNVVRAEATADHDLTALDRAVDRIEQRLRRVADRNHSRYRRATKEVQVPPLTELGMTELDQRGLGDPHGEVPTEPDVVFADGPVVVREKLHAAEPMTVEQALDAMEAVDHDFFMFHDADTDAAAVVYRRRGYDYGLIRLTVDGASSSAGRGDA
jgi:ribosomal subunit interface protein